MKKLILCDVDGTILDGARKMNHVSSKTKYAFKQLSKDNDIFIATGRCYGLLDQEILALKPNGYILCNGAYGLYQDKKIYSETFSLDTVRKIIDVSLKYHGFYVLESFDKMYVNDLKAENFIKFINGWGQALTNFDELKDLNLDYHIAMIGFTSEEDCKNAEKELKDDVSLARHNGFKSYDVNIKGIDKGYGVKRIIEELKINPNETYCFGDGLNDLEMLKAVKHGVIMANCDEKLKGLGFEETNDVLDDGFYQYLLKNNLLKEE